MRVLVMDINTTGQGWGEVDRHLPHQYKKLKNGMASGAWHERRDWNIRLQSRRFGSHIRFSVMVFTSARTSLHQKARSINAEVMGGASRAMTKNDKVGGGPGEAATLLFYLLFSLASGLTSNFRSPEGIRVPLSLGSALLAKQILFLFVFLFSVLCCCFHVLISVIHLLFWLLVSGTGRDFSELSSALLEKGFKLSKGCSISKQSCCHPPVHVVVPHSSTSTMLYSRCLIYDQGWAAIEASRGEHPLVRHLVNCQLDITHLPEVGEGDPAPPVPATGLSPLLFLPSSPLIVL